jgi:flagellin-specific chaperone FliS
MYVANDQLQDSETGLIISLYEKVLRLLADIKLKMSQKDVQPI